MARGKLTSMRAMRGWLVLALWCGGCCCAGRSPPPEKTSTAETDAQRRARLDAEQRSEYLRMTPEGRAAAMRMNCAHVDGCSAAAQIIDAAGTETERRKLTEIRDSYRATGGQAAGQQTGSTSGAAAPPERCAGQVLCRDGSCSSCANHRGCCSRHGGVQRW